MAVEVRRKPNENTYTLLRRFSDKVKKGRVMILSKKNQFHQKPKSKHQQKEEAQKRNAMRAKRNYLIKTGKLDENASMFPNARYKK